MKTRHFRGSFICRYLPSNSAKFGFYHLTRNAVVRKGTWVRIPKNCDKADISHAECYDFYKNIIKPLKESALYEKQSLDKFGFSEYSYSKAGNSHILLYKNGELLNLISTRSNDKETRINYSKIAMAGINLELFHENSQKYQSEFKEKSKQNLQIENAIEDIEER